MQGSDRGMLLEAIETGFVTAAIVAAARYSTAADTGLNKTNIIYELQGVKFEQALQLTRTVIGAYTHNLLI